MRLQIAIVCQMQRLITKPYDLEERLVEFAAATAIFTRSHRSDESSQYYARQLMRASGSAALNYGEVLGTNTARDYVNKASIVIKELKESRVCLKILRRLDSTPELASSLLDETEELIRIVSVLRNKKS